MSSDPGGALKPLKSRLLISAQELGRLETIFDLFVENRVPHVLMLLTGMQSNGRQRVPKEAFDAVQAEVLELIEVLFIGQANLLQPLLPFAAGPAKATQPSRPHSYLECHININFGSTPGTKEFTNIRHQVSSMSSTPSST
ncbi:hypothetical protein [Deinococcus rubellus]|uniref:hypothetical protein n=1 Tax=Deinococcus rubellus TaxID=1889240 RepID=UPI0031E77932